MLYCEDETVLGEVLMREPGTYMARVGKETATHTTEEEACAWVEAIVKAKYLSRLSANGVEAIRLVDAVHAYVAHVQCEAISRVSGMLTGEEVAGIVRGACARVGPEMARLVVDEVNKAIAARKGTGA